MFDVSCCLSSPGTGNIAAAYNLRFAAANLVIDIKFVFRNFLEK